MARVEINTQLRPITATRQQPPTAPAAPTTPSTGSKVAVGAAAVGASALVTVAIVSAVTGWSVTKILDKAYDKVTGKKKR